MAKRKSEKEAPTIMLYKYPGPHELQDGNYDYIIVEETDPEIAKAEKDGWSLTPKKAKAAYEKAKKKEEK